MNKIMILLQGNPAASIDQLLIAFLIIGVILGVWYIWNKNSENS